MRNNVRNNDKMMSLVKLISEFNYTTTKLLCEYCGLSTTGQYRFIKNLVRIEYIHEVEVNAVSSKLLLPTKQFVRYASEYAENTQKLNTLPSRINESLIRHTLYLQAVLVQYGDSTPQFIADNNLGFQRKRPDLILNNDIAIELENTHKNTNRIYHGFINHIIQIEKKQYSKVIYIATNKNLYLSLKSKFDEISWPIVIYKKDVKKLYSTGKTASVNKHSRMLFEFKLMEYRL